jgi:hypothetical protein
MKYLSNPIIVLIIIALVIYLFSPQAGLVKNYSPSNTTVPVVYHLVIQDSVLSDPRLGDLKVKVGSRNIIEVITDKDGRLDMNGQDRDLFNPIFSGITNSINIPADKPNNFRLVFHPGAEPNQDTKGILIGTVIIEQ